MLKSINIQQELSQISQTVAELTEETPFSSPSSAYFEQLSSNILQKIRRQEEDPAIDFLKDINKENPFQVPDGYFRDFKPAIANEKLKSGKLIPLGTILRYSVAACVIGLIITLAKLNDKGNNATNAEFAMIEENSKNISLDAFESYLNEAAVSGIPEFSHDEAEADEHASLLVEINKETILEILQEIPENDISLYLDNDGYNDTEMMN